MRLADLQRRFVANLYGEPADLRDVVRDEGGIAVADRVAIYRNNLPRPRAASPAASPAGC